MVEIEVPENNAASPAEYVPELHDRIDTTHGVVYINNPKLTLLPRLILTSCASFPYAWCVHWPVLFELDMHTRVLSPEHSLVVG